MIKCLGLFTVISRKYMVIRFCSPADFFDTLKVCRHITGSDKISMFAFSADKKAHEVPTVLVSLNVHISPEKIFCL